jgi:beta-galactosidase
LVAATILMLHPGQEKTSQSVARTFAVDGNEFTLDGTPFQIISGEMHYPRIPRQYWRDRLKKAHAMGLNTVSVYAFWNVHEPQPGVFNFAGQNDIAEFIRETQREGLYVVLRPGPYICAEWEFGGYPAWLLRDHDLQLRTRDPQYMTAVRRYLLRLGQELAPLQIGNGGPIIAVQIENEYGSFGNDHIYMLDMKQALIDSGFTKAVLYSEDGPVQVANGSLQDILVGLSFGTGDSKQAARYFRRTHANQLIFNSEYWVGWFDHWGAKHGTRDSREEADEIAWILQQGGSINLYMEEGGTSSGWMNGANSNGENYEPDTTSYDYDAPLDESGRPREKYFLFRSAIAKAMNRTAPPVPHSVSPIALASITFGRGVSLWKTLPQPVLSEQPLSMEDLGQAYGYILYRTNIFSPGDAILKVTDVHSFAQIYVDGKLAGTLDRRFGQSTLPLHLVRESQLDILVENTGRLNYGKKMNGERAGITKEVLLNDLPITHWLIYSLPLDLPNLLTFTNTPCTGACFFRATLHVAVPGDTFLDTSELGKGQLWINGHNLGRFWNVGPQQTLYVPGPWLHKGANDIVIFDLMGKSGRNIRFRAQPRLAEVRHEP